MDGPVDSLLQWFARCGRSLPWRAAVRDPYAVLVSELMLQQTQVHRVVPRFVAFMKRFPTLHELAQSEPEEVLAAWSGLGYYRRARMLHELARQLAATGSGLPQSAGELEKLPGIGPYTAAAVASLAFGEAVPVLDGNVIRVAARYRGDAGEPRAAAARRRSREWVRELMQGRPPGAVNEALMELGALCCVPRRPDCAACPLREHCACKSPEAAALIPPPRRSRATEALSWVAAIVVKGDGCWLLRQVTEGPILRGLWLPPLAQLGAGQSPSAIAESLLPPGLAHRGGVLGAPVSHAITHRRITVHPVVFATATAQVGEGPWRWAQPGAGELATSSLLAKLAAALISTDDD